VEWAFTAVAVHLTTIGIVFQHLNCCVTDAELPFEQRRAVGDDSSDIGPFTNYQMATEYVIAGSHRPDMYIMHVAHARDRF
jgi:hypothetical protein